MTVDRAPLLEGAGCRPARRPADHRADPSQLLPTRTAACPPTSGSSSSATRCSGWSSPRRSPPSTRTAPRANWPSSSRRRQHPGAGASRHASSPTTGLARTCCSAAARSHSGGAQKSSLLADGLESLLGAIYVQHGHAVAREVIIRLFGDATGHRADARRRSGLEDQPAGTGRRARLGRAVLRGDFDRARARQGVHRDGRSSTTSTTARARGAPRRRPSSTAGRRGVDALPDRGA